MEELLDLSAGTPVLLLALCFPPRLHTPPEHLRHVTVYPLELCLHLLCGKTQVDDLVRGGAYLTSPGWLEHWHEHLERWGFDGTTASLFFGDVAKRIVLLDSGCSDDAPEHLANFAAHVGLPATRLPVGLDMLTQHLRGLLLAHRSQDLEADAASWREQAAQYGMALDLLDGLTGKTTVADAVRGVEELFRLLMAPREVAFHLEGDFRRQDDSCTGTTESAPPELARRLDAEGVVAHETGDGFWLSLRSGTLTVGQVLVSGVAIPVHLQRYLNLALSIAPLCALAVNKAHIAEELQHEVAQLERRTEELQARNRDLEEAHEQIAVLRGIVPICMHCKQIRDDQGYWNKLETFISEHSGAQFSHGVCPKCFDAHYPDLDGNDAEGGGG